MRATQLKSYQELQFKGHLDGLTSIDKELAQQLATFEGSLFLNGLASIDKDVARELAIFKVTSYSSTVQLQLTKMLWIY